MFKAMKRWWAYLSAKTNKSLDDRADPAVQLEQAVAEAQSQHRRLIEQAANVIAQQKQAELRLNRQMGELEKANANARQAVVMADDAGRSGDATKAAEYTTAAESFANRMVALETEVEDLKTTALQATQAADQAKAAVTQNGTLLQQKLAERQKLLGQLEQTKMQETMNKAMDSLQETVGQDVPTLDEVRMKIEARYAKAKGVSELTSGAIESRTFEIEQAVRNTEAKARLESIRTELGISAGPAAGAGQLGQGQPADVPADAPSDAGSTGTPAPADANPDA
jgi:phage shock protein A